MFSIKTSSTSFSFEVFCLGTFWASSWGPWFWLDFVLGRWLCKIIVQVESIYKVKKQFFHLWVLHFQELAQKPYTFFSTTHNTQTYQEKDLKKNTNNKISLQFMRKFSKVLAKQRCIKPLLHICWSKSISLWSTRFKLSSTHPTWSHSCKTFNL